VCDAPIHGDGIIAIFVIGKRQVIEVGHDMGAVRVDIFHSLCGIVGMKRIRDAFNVWHVFIISA
jgi:hypothetical protein